MRYKRDKTKRVQNDTEQQVPGNACRGRNCRGEMENMVQETITSSRQQVRTGPQKNTHKDWIAPETSVEIFERRTERVRWTTVVHFLRRGYHHNGDQTARRPHMVFSICVLLFSALSKSVLLFMGSHQSQTKRAASIFSDPDMMKNTVPEATASLAAKISAQTAYTEANKLKRKNVRANRRA